MWLAAKAQKVEKMAEEKKAREVEGCTFSPQTHTRQRSRLSRKSAMNSTFQSGWYQPVDESRLQLNESIPI